MSPFTATVQSNKLQEQMETMSRYNYVTEVLRELGNDMGMGPLELDDTNRLSLVFDGVLVTLSYTTDPLELLWIYVDLGDVPPDNIHVPREMLKLGFECWGQNVMTIGLDEEGSKAIGYSSIPVTVLELPVLREMLSRMLQATFLVREHLAKAALDENNDEASQGTELEPVCGVDTPDYA